MRAWALLADTIPLYPLYALLFAHVGLSDAEISALFVIWSMVGVVAEVPSGALADRFSRRGAIVAGGVLQALGYLLWTAWPGFAVFAIGFALWASGGALVSGAFEALLHDGLSAAGAAEHFTRVYGQVNALELIAQIPAALAATMLFAVGDFTLVGWASVGMCLIAAFVASRLPEPPRGHGEGETDGEHTDPRGYLTVLRTGAVEAFTNPMVRSAVVVVALLASLDGLEEYFPLLARDWHVPTGLVPLAMMGIPIAGAVGSALAGRLDGLRPRGLTSVLVAAVLVLAAAGLAGHPVGLVGVAVFYALYRAVLVVGQARLQERIESGARATVTSFAGLGTDLAVLLVFGAWAVGGLPAVSALALLVALALPYGLYRPARTLTR